MKWKWRGNQTRLDLTNLFPFQDGKLVIQQGSVLSTKPAAQKVTNTLLSSLWHYIFWAAMPCCAMGEPTMALDLLVWKVGVSCVCVCVKAQDRGGIRKRQNTFILIANNEGFIPQLLEVHQWDSWSITRDPKTCMRWKDGKPRSYKNSM